MPETTTIIVAQPEISPFASGYWIPTLWHPHTLMHLPEWVVKCLPPYVWIASDVYSRHSMHRCRTDAYLIPNAEPIPERGLALLRIPSVRSIHGAASGLFRQARGAKPSRHGT